VRQGWLEADAAILDTELAALEFLVRLRE